MKSRGGFRLKCRARDLLASSSIVGSTRGSNSLLLLNNLHNLEVQAEKLNFNLIFKTVNGSIDMHRKRFLQNTSMCCPIEGWDGRERDSCFALKDGYRNADPIALPLILLTCLLQQRITLFLKLSLNLWETLKGS